MEDLHVQAGAAWQRVIAGHLMRPAKDQQEDLNRLKELATQIKDPSLDFAIRQACDIARDGIAAINVMGTMGSGKSAIGAALAQELGRTWTFRDGDYFHPESNIEKMRRGEALTDEDRIEFLAEAGRFLRSKAAVISSCSALRDSYRAMLHGCPSLMPTSDRWEHGDLATRLVTVCIVKPFAVALEQLDYAEKNSAARRTFRGEDHFIHVTEESPTILQKQYDDFERPKPWQAIVLETELYRLQDSSLPTGTTYDTKKMILTLVEALGMRAQ